jgi:hypothetical protein
VAVRAVRALETVQHVVPALPGILCLRGDVIIPEPGAGIRPENCGKTREIAGNRGMVAPI